ncbi:DUF2812 domain-containing protein [Lysinibacillus piscis]|uniref:DUF2812 domain-containing protein n=1 Tax=Lysinibacillus piscis TaxID=2518931 RepID=A0ABQ5NER3_9BACI|nr:DUF2812 domain-containing protein [Lysinibacillus sp. KH24]GLC86878.1 hypothetical protein LYSBPC_00050 [Lysinibacillus sp. KH24]
MKKKIYRFFVDYEKEEAWVNEMAAQGWHLEKAILFYFIFEQGQPGEYIYRNELVIGKSKDYFDFLQSMNIDYVTKHGAWAYYRKKTADGPFELLSDHHSKVKYLTWIRNVMLLMALIDIFVVCINIVQDHYLNKGVGLLDALLLWPLSILMIRVNKRKKRLQKEAQLFER